VKKLDFNLSASTINNFVACPWAFQQDKILKRQVTKVPSAPLVFGQAFHKLLEFFYRKGTFSTYDLFQNWEKFFNIEVKAQCAEGLQYLSYSRATGFTMIKNWVAMAKTEGWLQKPFGIELEFMLPYNNDKYSISVHGYMDLVINVNDDYYILDWKSGKHSEGSYNKQAILYSWALYKKYGLIEK